MEDERAEELQTKRPRTEQARMGTGQTDREVMGEGLNGAAANGSHRRY